MTKLIKVGKDLAPNTFIVCKAIPNIELVITLISNHSSLKTAKVFTLPCIIPPEELNPESNRKCYKYSFYHSHQELHNAITAVNGEFEIQIIDGDSLVTDHAVGMYAANLSVLLSSGYSSSMPGILISDNTEIPLYIIQVDMTYDYIRR